MAIGIDMVLIGPLLTAVAAEAAVWCHRVRDGETLWGRARQYARALADACLPGADHPAHRFSDPPRHVRGRLLARDALVRTRYISLIRAVLRQHGYRVPSDGSLAATRVLPRRWRPHPSTPLMCRRGRPRP